MKFGVLTMIFFGGEGLKSVSRRRGRLLRWCCAWQTPGYILRAPAFCGRRCRQRCRSAQYLAGTMDFQGCSDAAHRSGCTVGCRWSGWYNPALRANKSTLDTFFAPNISIYHPAAAYHGWSPDRLIASDCGKCCSCSLQNLFVDGVLEFSVKSLISFFAIYGIMGTLSILSSRREVAFRVLHNLFCYFRIGKRSRLLHLQMVGWRWQVTDSPACKRKPPERPFRGLSVCTDGFPWVHNLLAILYMCTAKNASLKCSIYSKSKGKCLSSTVFLTNWMSASSAVRPYRAQTCSNWS